jgi:hypothetical protein
VIVFPFRFLFSDLLLLLLLPLMMKKFYARSIPIVRSAKRNSTPNRFRP